MNDVIMTSRNENITLERYSLPSTKSGVNSLRNNETRENGFVDILKDKGMIGLKTLTEVKNATFRT